MLEVKNFKEAEKLIKKELKKKNEQIKTHLLYGDLLLKQNLESKAEQHYEQAIKNINASNRFSQVAQLANEFQVRGRVDLAIRTYEKAKKLNANPVAYNIRIGELYGANGQPELMIKEFLSMLEVNPGYQAQVQSALSRSIDFKENKKEADL